MTADLGRYANVDSGRAGLAGRCPRCGEGRLFAGVLRLAPSCTECGLDFTPFDSADGPAFFVMSIVGFVTVGLALWVEVAFSPPIWVHLVLWVPLMALMTMPLLRLSKGLLIGLQFRNKAEEGRVTRGSE